MNSRVMVMISPVYANKRRSHSISRLKQYNYEDWLWFDVRFSLSGFTRSKSNSANPLFPRNTICYFKVHKSSGKCSCENSTRESYQNFFNVHARQKTCYSGNLATRIDNNFAPSKRGIYIIYVTFSFECQNQARFPAWKTRNNFHCWSISLPLA